MAAISTLAVVVVVHLNAVLHFDESQCVPALSDIGGDFVEKDIASYLAGTDGLVLDALKSILQFPHYLHSSSCCCNLNGAIIVIFFFIFFFFFMEHKRKNLHAALFHATDD